MKYKFRVILTETYEKEFSVDADSLKEAKEHLQSEIDENPIETTKHTFQESTTDIEVKINGKGWVDADLEIARQSGVMDSNDLDADSFGDD